MPDRETLSVGALAPTDPASGVPIYRQIADQLEALLRDVAIGTRLPSETEISKRIGISRGTAVQALRELERRELVTRIQGRGTFKASPPPGAFTRSLDQGTLPSFTEDLRQAGHTTWERIERCVRTTPSADAAAALGLQADDEVWLIDRTVLADDSPVVHIVSALRADRYPEVDPDAVSAGSLYGFLEERYGVAGRPSWAQEEYTATVAGDTMAEQLRIPVGSALLCSRRTAFLSDGLAAEFVLSTMRADAYSVRVTLLPGGAPATTGGLALKAPLA